MKREIILKCENNELLAAFCNKKKKNDTRTHNRRVNSVVNFAEPISAFTTYRSPGTYYLFTLQYGI